MKKLKLFTLALAAIFTVSAMAETETHPASASSDGEITGVSYTLPGTYIAGVGGTKAGTMTSKGIKFRINKVYGDYSNAVPFTVNEGYTITNISFDGHVNDNNKTSVLGKVMVDGAEITFTAVTLPNKKSSLQFSTGEINAKNEVVLLFDGAASQANIEYTVTYELAQYATDDATLKSITVDGEAVEGFTAETLTYNVELPFGTTVVPTVVATTTSPKAKVLVTPATSLPGVTTIVVTAEDNTTTKTYTVNFSIASAASTDATLKSLKINDKAISGFKADSLEYAYQLDYANPVTLPKVTAELNDETASMVITDITALPGTATVVVTAQDGVTTKTYTIAFTMAQAPKILSEVVFSNGAKGAAVASAGTLRFPYIAGTAVPTISSITVNEGATYVQGENKITVTGEDGTSLEYAITAVELTPAVLADNVEVTFDGTENYIFCPYGWDSGKGWKFSKDVEQSDNRRVSEGRSRIYMALPAAKEVVLTSGSGGKRGVKIYVNNVENTSVKEIAKEGESISIALNSTSVNLLAIESDGNNGDGGFTKIKLVPVTSPTGVDEASVEVKVVKRLVNGQLVIEKDGVLYNALGNVVK